MNVLRVFALVYSTKVRDRHIVAEVVGWSIGLLAFLCLSMAGFFFLPLLWALLSEVLVVAILTLIALHRIGDAVMAAALSDPEFYQLVGSQRALAVASDGEGNLPRLNKVVPMRDPRQARRR